MQEGYHNKKTRNMICERDVMIYCKVFCYSETDCRSSGSTYLFLHHFFFFCFFSRVRTPVLIKKTVCLSFGYFIKETVDKIVLIV